MSTYQIIQGDCLQVLPTMEADSADSVVTDPPYHLTTGKKGGTGPAPLTKSLSPSSSPPSNPHPLARLNGQGEARWKPRN